MLAHVFKFVCFMSRISNEKHADAMFMGWKLLAYVLRAYPSVYWIGENVH